MGTSGVVAGEAGRSPPEGCAIDKNDPGSPNRGFDLEGVEIGWGFGSRWLGKSVGYIPGRFKPPVSSSMRSRMVAVELL